MTLPDLDPQVGCSLNSSIVFCEHRGDKRGFCVRVSLPTRARRISHRPVRVSYTFTLRRHVAWTQFIEPLFIQEGTARYCIERVLDQEGTEPLRKLHNPASSPCWGQEISLVSLRPTLNLSSENDALLTFFPVKMHLHTAGLLSSDAGGETRAATVGRNTVDHRAFSLVNNSLQQARSAHPLSHSFTQSLTQSPVCSRPWLSPLFRYLENIYRCPDRHC